MTTAPDVQRWTPQLAFQSELDRLRTANLSAYRANPHLIEEHARQEEQISVGGYASRVLRELIQNAADAMAGAQSVESGQGRIKIILDLDSATLYVANAGLPVSKKGLIGLTHAHLSGKRGDEIGKFGLGFKSVLSVTPAPEVYSRTISFSFGQASDVEGLRSIRPGLTSYPTLRMALEIDALSASQSDPILGELMEWASTVVRLPHLKSYASLLQEIKDFDGLFLLFVEHVVSLDFEVRGTGGFTVTHSCRPLGDGVFAVTDTSGKESRMAVASEMFAPSREARLSAGSTVTRESVKISVAIPLDSPKDFEGSFWSYFPLKDRTSARAIFNAPWSLVDDRTSMIDNVYNKEMQDALLNLFIGNLHRVAAPSDPGRLLDYLPARGTRRSEAAGDADYRFRQIIPLLASQRSLIPDARGTLSTPSTMVPLDLNIEMDYVFHRLWQAAENTPDNVPHWSCYATPTRYRRLRDIFAAPMLDLAKTPTDSDRDSVFRRLEHRRLGQWFQEWVAGARPETQLQAVSAAATLADQRKEYRQVLETAAFIPTDQGLRSPSSRRLVFLRGADGYAADGFAFVSDSLTSLPGAKKALQVFGFVELDPKTKLKAQLKSLSSHDSTDVHARLWQSLTQDLTVPEAAEVLRRNGAALMVPTLSGEWKRPDDVLDVPVLRDLDEARQYSLDHHIVPPGLASALGIVSAPVKNFPLHREPLFGEFLQDVLDGVNSDVEDGDRGVESVTFSSSEGPGPASVLPLLERAESSPALIHQWTKELLSLSGEDFWTAVDDLNGEEYEEVLSPRRWAVEKSGLVSTAWGLRNPLSAVSPRMLEFRDLLPICMEHPRLVEGLGLPDSIADIDMHFLSDSLIERHRDGHGFPMLTKDKSANRTLEKFAREVGQAIAEYDDIGLTHLPAWVGNEIRITPVQDIYIAENHDQVEYLIGRNKSYLLVTSTDARSFTELTGTQDFTQVFSFEINSEGRRVPELILDRFPALASYPGARDLRGCYLVACERITKSTGTVSDTVTAPLDSHWDRDSNELLVRTDLSNEQVLHKIAATFALDSISVGDIQEILDDVQQGELQALRDQAKGTDDDARKLDIYLSRDHLIASLPPGLWEGLEDQGCVDETTSVAELCLAVHGNATVKELRGWFRDKGFTDVPSDWRRNRTTLEWLDKMGFSQRFAPDAVEHLDETLTVEGAVKLPDLHDFQRRVAGDIQRRVLSTSGGKSSKFMVDMPTGTGKTRVAVQSICELFSQRRLSGPVLWIAESEELCEQAVQTWRFVWRGLRDTEPLTIGRLWRSRSVPEPVTEYSVIVATDAQLHSIVKNSVQAGNYDWLAAASVVIVDEAHRSGSSSMYTEIFRWLGVDGHHDERPLMGLSATPFKGGETQTDQLVARYGRELVRGFTSDNPFSEATRGGYLARVKYETLTGIEVSLNAEEARSAQRFKRVDADVLERIGNDRQRMRLVVDHILENIPKDWPVLVFTPSVLSAQVLAATLKFHGVSAASVSGSTTRSERRRIIEAFKAGEIQVLTNCELLAQGFDAPGVRALYIARPTFSRSAFVQMVGRGLRGEENGGKPECLIVNIKDNFGGAQQLLDDATYIDAWTKED